MTLFPTLGTVLRELDPEAIPMPLLLPAVSDARFFARLGIQTYGFLPMQLPAEMRFMELVHAENERLPIAAMDLGPKRSGDCSPASAKRLRVSVEPRRTRSKWTGWARRSRMRPSVAWIPRVMGRR
jgi:hypothetical protein